MRICNTCQEEKQLNDFYKRNHGKYYLYVCKTCYKIQRKKYITKPKIRGHWKAAHIRWKYGLELDQVFEMLENQNYRCLICDIEFSNNGKSATMCIDHNHITNKVRGLICNSCNLGIGMFKDNKILVAKALEYLEKEDALS